ncbi:MAG: class III poly(R)-hydroxyalkanoic acid synthase subunit PhaC [Halobacteriales archaeon SW_9_67_25]|nr:MAG: class III poly(R)-hydroxyalkanoic acid synthase subunit PhaC [Halobacteriales archaeon SW_9_67_25]
MVFNPLAASLDAGTAALEALTDATRKGQVLPERLGEMATVDVGQTPAEVVYEENKLELLHYEPRTAEQYDTPMLVVWSLINRPYILDLQPDRSVVRRLLEGGHDIYMIRWNEPSRLDQHLGMADYVDRYIANCVDAVRERSGAEAVNLVGYCIGGALTAMYAARNPEKVNTLGQIAGTLCFEGDGGVLELWGADAYFDPESVVDVSGNVPADLLAGMFEMMDPVRNTVSKYVTLYERLDDADFVANFARMERWLDEGVGVAGTTYVEFMETVYQDDRLRRNELELDGRPVDVGNIDMPVLQIVGEYDDLVPPEASVPFNHVVGSDETEIIEFPTGHIGISVSSSAHEAYWPRVAEWFAQYSGERGTPVATGQDDAGQS